MPDTNSLGSAPCFAASDSSQAKASSSDDGALVAVDAGTSSVDGLSFKNVTMVSPTAGADSLSQSGTDSA